MKSNICDSDNSIILVIFKEIVRYKEALQTLKVLIIEHSLFFHLEYLVRAVGL